MGRQGPTLGSPLLANVLLKWHPCAISAGQIKRRWGCPRGDSLRPRGFDPDPVLLVHRLTGWALPALVCGCISEIVTWHAVGKKVESESWKKLFGSLPYTVQLYFPCTMAPLLRLTVLFHLWNKSDFIRILTGLWLTVRPANTLIQRTRLRIKLAPKTALLKVARFFWWNVFSLNMPFY